MIKLLNALNCGLQFFDKWTLSQLDAADYEEAPPAPEWVVREAAQREGAIRRSEYEQREALADEMPGVGIKHHISQDEMAVRRRNSVVLDDGGGGGGDVALGAVRRRSANAEAGAARDNGRGSGGASSGVAAVSAAAGQEGAVWVDVGPAVNRRSRELPERLGDE